ncbi:hypothetical protein ACFPL7_11235 [Dongia soli]|uniref:Uncharacterized protein n=1 Tax=Dongia soli TaxID=600628 RepID=A0ABU5EBF5_9PROT|nr:hypothetical protein [Dongia soli]MDY0883523.1 hypothetical protein [Dongia soli]
MESKLAQAKLAQALAQAAKLSERADRPAAADQPTSAEAEVSHPSTSWQSDSNDNHPETFDPGVFDSLGYDPRGFGPNEWLEANLAIEARYLFLSRASIREMCLDLKAKLTRQIQAALDEKLDNQTELRTTSPDHRAAAAATLVAELTSDMSSIFTWEQAKDLVEPYAKGSWLLAQVQSHEEARLVTVYASELTRQVARYVQSLVFRAYGVNLPAPSTDGNPLPQPLYWVDETAPSDD